jgi:prepilin-type N-terminal cleavage/methylation domain-containing protein
MRARRAVTLLETVVVLAIFSVVLGVALPRFARLRDRLAVTSATTEVAALLAFARHAAVVSSRTVGVRFDTAAATVTLTTFDTAADTLRRDALGAAHGVSLNATRDSIAYGPLGLGYGAANTRVIVRRNAAADTVWVSRLGRVRR